MSAQVRQIRPQAGHFLNGKNGHTSSRFIVVMSTAHRSGGRAGQAPRAPFQPHYFIPMYFSIPENARQGNRKPFFTQKT